MADVSDVSSTLGHFFLTPPPKSAKKVTNICTTETSLFSSLFGLFLSNFHKNVNSMLTETTPRDFWNISSTFLAANAETTFCWNFWEITAEKVSFLPSTLNTHIIWIFTVSISKKKVAQSETLQVGDYVEVRTMENELRTFRLYIYENETVKTLPFNPEVSTHRSRSRPWC